MKQILFTIILIISLISASMPGFLIEDINRDSHVDLMDAVAQMKNLEDNAENTQTLSGDFSNTVSTFQIVAGMKTQIKKETTNNINGQSGLYILTSKIRLPDFPYIIQSFQPDETFHSAVTPPPIPPPEIV